MPDAQGPAPSVGIARVSDPGTQAARLAALLDREDIVALQDRYWLGVGRFDIELILSCFADDALYGTARGHEAIRAHLQQLRALRDCTVLRGASSIEIDGDRATSETFAIAFLTIGEGDRRRATVQGLRYFDTLARTAEGWRIQARCGREEPHRVHDNPWQIDAITAPVFLA
jgi:hypothetical protein